MNTLLDRIKLKNEEVEQVNNAHDHLLSVLNGKASQGSLPTAKNFILIGSYARNTKITPLDDVDIFYVIGKANRVNGDWHTIMDCDFTFGQDYLDANNNISSLKILNLLKKEIDATYTSSEIRRDGEVVNLFLSSYGVGFDIAPVFEITNEDYFLMPEGKGLHKWKKTNPLIDHATMEELNERHNYVLKDLILIMKYWFKRKRIKSPRSYHLEAIVHHLFDYTPASAYRHEDGLNYLLANLNKNNFLYSCPDPTGLSEPLSSGFTNDDVINIQNEANIAMQHLSLGNEKFVEYVD
jgi:hypothetical protein